MLKCAVQIVFIGLMSSSLITAHSPMAIGADKKMEIAQKQEISPLKTLALKAYVKALAARVPKKPLSDQEVVAWCQEQGLDRILYAGFDELDAALSASFSCQKTGLYCPNVFAEGSDIAWHDDWENRNQYLVRTNGLQIAKMPQHFVWHPIKCSDAPRFTPHGKWLVGWKERKKSMPYQLLVMECADSMRTFDIEFKQFERFVIDWAFPDNDTIILRTDTELFIGPITDFGKKGLAALKKLYTRTDTLRYPDVFSYKTVYAISGAIVCVGPNQKTLEIMRANESGDLVCDSKIEIPNIAVGRIIVNSARGIVALRVSAVDKVIQLYQLDGEGSGKKGTIQIKDLGVGDSFVFSPDGKFLACSTDLNRSVIELYDCTDLLHPVQYATTPPLMEGSPATCVAWTQQALIARDGYGQQYTLIFNPAAPLIKRYAAYRTKQSEESKKEKASNNNNA